MNKRRNFRYIKIKDDEPKKPKKREKGRVARNIGHALTVVGTTVSSMLLILVIMMCIVVTVITVYILDFADNGYDAKLRDAEMKYTTMIYGYDTDGREIELKRLYEERNRIWVNYEDISPYIVYAVVSTEDKRFYEHKGVDWRRTVYALAADVLHLSGEGQGGSTITQQLIKNLTQDDEQTWERKLREIFRALSLEEKYTKIDIIESYLNAIWFDGMIYGVGAASQYYFDKDAKDLDIAEAAILAGMIRNPYLRSPYNDLENCKYWQEYALRNMYEQGYINTKEYESAKVEKVRFAGTVYGDDFGYTDPRSIQTDEPEEEVPDEEEDDGVDDDYEAYRWDDYEVDQDWYVDAAIDQVIQDYADLKGVTYTSARRDIYNGGYRIYINENMAFQELIEEKFRDPYLVVSSYGEDDPPEDLLQSAFVLMDYSGTVLAVAGGLGDKPGINCFNRATQATRPPGSTMKPISAYATAVQNNLITYSMMLPDKGISVIDGTQIKTWPTNFNFEGGNGDLMPIWSAVRESRNTIAVRVAQMLTPQVCYNQLTQNLGITTLVDMDIDYSPITLGALTNGIRLVELAAAYQIFGNGGVYYEPKFYSKVIDSKDNVILEQNFYGTQAIDSDAAWVTNRMLRTVITTTNGSGRHANLENVEVIGKTGTSNDEYNLLFVGCTPNYVGVVWMGYDENNHKLYNGDGSHRYGSQIWYDIMSEIEDTSVVNKFTPDSSVLERRYCTETGLIASAKCTSTDVGYYRKGNIPEYCSGNHEAETEKIKSYWDAKDKEHTDELQEILDGWY
ncbi:MAG: transglycosylase domain-containing protein [Lachnospiraceae bacterium]|nr:transglycosylase domain-containing protein [Ruminococcus sp.]MCM1276068.1 transglycosylase domain-containing protein [Lachnospiraceae bacterium]